MQLYLSATVSNPGIQLKYVERSENIMSFTCGKAWTRIKDLTYKRKTKKSGLNDRKVVGKKRSRNDLRSETRNWIAYK